MSRTCGDCCLCCRLLAVTEIGKPADTWCSLIQIGKGCSVYADRPGACREFNCLWLQREDGLPEDMRPDKIRAVFSCSMSGRKIVIHIDPATPNHYQTHKQIAKTIERLRRQKFDVIIVCGEKRTLLPAGE